MKNLKAKFEKYQEVIIPIIVVGGFLAFFCFAKAVDMNFKSVYVTSGIVKDITK